MIDLNVLKLEILNEHNKVRQDPKSYIPLLEQQLKYFNKDVLYKPGETGIMTEEGPDAYKGCIAFLKSQKPLKPLTLNDSLSKAAQDHANDIGPKGLLEHAGSNGSSPSDRIEKYINWNVTIAENLDFGGKTAQDIIISLIVDDGVPDRGHRLNIFKPDVKYVGIGLSRHNSEYEICTVLDYVGDIIEEKGKIKTIKLDTIKFKNPVNTNTNTQKQGQQPQATTTTTTVKQPEKKEAPQAKTKEQPAKKDAAKQPSSRSPKKKKDKTKQENFFGSLTPPPYNLNNDPDKPNGAVDCKVKYSTTKVNGVAHKFTIKTYKMKNGSEIVLEIEEFTD